MNIDKVREAFPHTRESIYMNHAALAPLSKPVTEVIAGYVQERHLTNIENYFDFLPIDRETRERIGVVIGTTSEQVMYTPNTSSGLNVLAQGLEWQAGDRVIIPGCEFPANVYPFMQLADRGVHVDLVPHHEGTFALEDVERLIQPQTRLLSVSWVQFLSGYRADLKALGALCKAHDILFCVDAIQGLGALQIDVESCGIDFLASGGHKWLMALQGIGLIYVSSALIPHLKPMAGWLHGPIDWERLIDYNLSFFDDARRFRPGTQNAIGIASLHASLGYYLSLGPAWCESQVLSRAGKLKTGLVALGLRPYGQAEGEQKSGIVTVRHSRANEVFEVLKKEGIHIAVRNGLLRFAPTYYNSDDEVERVLDVMAKLLAMYPV